MELSSLGIELVIGSNGESRKATIAEVQTQGKQNLVVLVGNKEFVRDSLLSAMIVKDRIMSQNMLLVPCYVDEILSDSDKAAKGFERKGFEDKPYVTKVVEPQSWSSYINEELSAAADQARTSVADLRVKGIVIVVNKEGKIVRRGLGSPDWSMVATDLNSNAKIK
jgi:hypothetical protein